MSDFTVQPDPTWLMIGGAPIRISAIKTIAIQYVDGSLFAGTTTGFEVRIYVSGPLYVWAGKFFTRSEAEDRVTELRKWLGIVDHEGHDDDEIWLS